MLPPLRPLRPPPPHQLSAALTAWQSPVFLTHFVTLPKSSPNSYAFATEEDPRQKLPSQSEIIRRCGTCTGGQSLRYASKLQRRPAASRVNDYFSLEDPASCSILPTVCLISHIRPNCYSLRKRVHGSYYCPKALQYDASTLVSYSLLS